MGYFKRKRTKRRGKKGTKKYRGGMSNAPAPNAATANAAAAKEAAKEEIKTKIGVLKSALDNVNLDVDLDKLKTMGEAMAATITALSGM
jgi:hypothetical protein